AGHVRVNSGLSVWSSSDVADDGHGVGGAGGNGNGNGNDALGSGAASPAAPGGAALLAMMAAASASASASASPRPCSAGGTRLDASPLPQVPQSVFMTTPSAEAGMGGGQ